MSTLEYVIWHVLGYTAVPVIFIAAFIAVAAVACFLIEAWQAREEKAGSPSLSSEQ